jgi:hypothetical protein
VQGLKLCPQCQIAPNILLLPLRSSTDQRQNPDQLFLQSGAPNSHAHQERESKSKAQDQRPHSNPILLPPSQRRGVPLTHHDLPACPKVHDIADQHARKKSPPNADVLADTQYDSLVPGEEKVRGSELIVDDLVGRSVLQDWRIGVQDGGGREHAKDAAAQCHHGLAPKEEDAVHERDVWKRDKRGVLVSGGSGRVGRHDGDRGINSPSRCEWLYNWVVRVVGVTQEAEEVLCCAA